MHRPSTRRGAADFPSRFRAARRRVYDYHAKYNSKDTQYICPAEVRRETQAEIELVSRTLYGLLQLDGVVRMDFIVREEDGQPVFLELNTLPGFTSHSLVPMAAQGRRVEFAAGARIDSDQQAGTSMTGLSASNPLRVAVAGSRGRMGSMAVEAINAELDLKLVLELTRQSVPADALDREKVDVLLDLSLAATSRTIAPLAARRGIAPVVGVSGWNADDLACLREACREGRVGGGWWSQTSRWVLCSRCGLPRNWQPFWMAARSTKFITPRSKTCLLARP